MQRISWISLALFQNSQSMISGKIAQDHNDENFQFQ